MDINAKIRQLENALRKSLAQQETLLAVLKSQPRSPTEEADAYNGRRIFYTLTERSSFTIAQLGVRGDPLIFSVSQDGPFVMTHYPLVMWKPNLPTTATRLGIWSAVGTWPLPTQADTDQDRIDLSYEFFDGGAQRNFQNAASPPVFSRPDNFVPLPVPTLFQKNASLSFYPTFEDILFDATGTASTGGELVVSLIGYRILSLTP